MLRRHCRVQSTPSEHQNENEVLDTESVGGRKAGHELIQELLLMDSALIAGTKYPLVLTTKYK